MTGATMTAATPRPEGRAVPWRGAVIVSGFAAFPFLTFLVDNRWMGIGVRELLPYAIWPLALGLVAIVASWHLGSADTADRVGVAAAAAMFAITNYSSVTGLLAGLRVRYQLAGWALLAVTILVFAWGASRRSVVREWLTFVAILLAFIPAAQLAWHRVTVADALVPASASGIAELQRTPDIYLVIPDAYTRRDALERWFDFDNTPFLDELVDRGFVVADDAYANYSTTYLSLPAILHMDYVVDAGLDALALHPSGHRFDRTAFYEILKGRSAIVDLLRDAGYVHVQAPPGNWSGSDCSGDEDLCIEPVPGSDAGIVVGDLEWELLRLTPVATILEVGFGETFDDVVSDPVHVVREIQRQQFEDPVFAFIHMMHSHPPFRFDARCGAIDEGGRNLKGWRPEGRGAYVEGVQCTNRRLLTMIDALPTDAIVIIQGDHGTNFLQGMGEPVATWTQDQILERLSILSAVRLPDDCRGMVGDDYAGVNTFRVVLACLSGQEPQLLPHRHMLAPDRGEPEVREVDRPVTP